jgi:hypothetical protein
MLRVFALLAGDPEYTDTMGREKQFHAIVRAWRPAEGKQRKETLWSR